VQLAGMKIRRPDASERASAGDSVPSRRGGSQFSLAFWTESGVDSVINTNCCLISVTTLLLLALFVFTKYNDYRISIDQLLEPGNIVQMIAESLLIQVPEHHRDPGWLEENADLLYEALDQALQNNESVGEAVDSLLTIFPQLLGREDLRRWARLIQLAYNRVRGESPADVPDQVSVGIYVLNRREKKPIKTKRRRRQQRIHPHEMFEMYLSLLMTQYYYQSEALTPERITGALEFGRTVNDPFLYHKLYQTLAFIYNQRGEFHRALDHARLAFSYWSQQDHPVETGLTAFAMGSAFQGKQEFVQAREWLQTAADIFSRIDYPAQYGLVALETACLYLWTEEYEAAIQWAEIALREFQAINQTYHTGLAYHWLGVAQGYLERYDEALENLDRSAEIWQELDNRPQFLHQEHSRAYIEARMGKTAESLERLHRTLDESETLPDSPWKSYRIERLQKLIRAIENGEDLTALSAAN
jgi:tetratricopeptide (TPR) repeat protein